MCPVMSWEHSGSIFDAALVGKSLHIWNVCSAICSTKMSVSCWVLVRFWIFKNPYESSCVLLCPGHVLPCPGHVLGMSWACSSHVRGTQQLAFAAFFSIFFNFFQFFSIFFSTLFAKNQLCYVKFVNPSPCSELFTWIPFIIFHILATEAPSNPLLMHFFPFFSIFFHFFLQKKFFFLESWLHPAMLVHFTLVLHLNFHILAIKRHFRLAPREILTLPFMTEIWHKNVSPGTPETPISGL